jgi:hypothetical protein
MYKRKSRSCREHDLITPVMANSRILLTDGGKFASATGAKEPRHGSSVLTLFMCRHLDKPFLLTVLLLISFAGTALGDITWKQTTCELHTAPDADPNTVLEAHYLFENAGSGSVDITAMQSDCGCTVPALAKRHYQPGEEGEITARFTVGEQMGRKEKHISVTVSGQAQPTVLTLIATVPELLRFDPPSLSWEKGEANTVKKIRVQAGEGIAVEALTVASSQTLFTAELHPSGGKGQYELAVTPARTDLSLQATFSLSGRFRIVDPVLQDNVRVETASTTIAKTLTTFATVKPAAFKKM